VIVRGRERKGEEGSTVTGKRAEGARPAAAVGKARQESKARKESGARRRRKLGTGTTALLR
jgi:hypothetical protein